MEDKRRRLPLRLRAHRLFGAVGFAFLIGARFYRYFFHFVFAFFLLSVLALDLNGTSSVNLQLLTIGLLGVILGYIPIEKINNFVKHPYLLIAAYLCYVRAQ